MVLVEEDAVARGHLPAVPEQMPFLVHVEEDGEVEAVAVDLDVLGPAWFYFYLLGLVFSLDVQTDGSNLVNTQGGEVLDGAGGYRHVGGR